MKKAIITLLKWLGIYSKKEVGDNSLISKTLMVEVKEDWPEDVEERHEYLNKIASVYNWYPYDFQPNIKMASYIKEHPKYGRMRINVYLTTLTISTYLKHPNKGKNQVFRRGLTPSKMIKVFENPRTHTNAGYRKKSK